MKNKYLDIKLNLKLDWIEFIEQITDGAWVCQRNRKSPFQRVGAFDIQERKLNAAKCVISNRMGLAIKQV